MKNLARNATWGGAVAAIRAMTGLFIALLAVRLLGGDLYGQLATLLSLFVLYLALNSSVFTVLVTKLMATQAAKYANKNTDILSAAILFTIFSIIVLSGLTALLWKITPNISSLALNNSNSTIEIQQAILAMGVLTTLQIMSALHSSLIESIGRLDLAMKWQLVGPVIVTTTLFFLLILQVPTSMPGYIAVLSGGALIDLHLLVLVRRKLMPLPFSLKASDGKLIDVWSLLKSGITLQAASLMSFFLEPMNKILLNHLIGSLAVTAYDLAMKLIWGIQNLFAAAMRVFLHMSNEQGRVVGRTFSRVFALVLIPVLITHVLAAVFLTWVTHQWIVIEDTQEIMIFFAIATLSNLGMIYITPPYISLISRSDLHFIFRCQSIVAATNLLVSVICIPFFGLLGAAFGLLIATIYNVTAIYRRHERIVGTSDELYPIFKKHSGRYSLTTLLFTVAILNGIGDAMNYFVQATLLLASVLIMKNEKLVNILITRFRGHE